MATQRVSFSFSGPIKSEYYAAISPRETYLASSKIFSRQISLWSIDTGEVVKELKGHESATIAVAFSKDEKTLASVGKDRTLKVWDLETQSLVVKHELPPKKYRSLRFHDDGFVVVEFDSGVPRSYAPLIGDVAE